MKDIRDKALAIETYARQAKNVEAEAKACEIRLRAERRAGQLIGEMDKAKGAVEAGTQRGTTPSPAGSASKPLSDLGISHNQSSRWQKLGKIPEQDFEQTFAKPGSRRTSSGHLPPPRLDAAQGVKHHVGLCALS